MTPPPSSLSFRSFRPEDATVLFPWLESAGLRTPPSVQDGVWVERICSDPRILCVAGVTGDGAVHGFFRLDVGPDGVAEVTLIVHPGQRRRGLGAELLEAALAEARRRGLRRLLAVVQDTNEKGYRFFSSRGFEPTGVWLPRTIHLARVVHGAEAQPPLEITI